MYLVIAYRTISVKSDHSYTVGIFDKKHEAIKAAESERDDRGGSYSCYVYEVETNKIIEYAKCEAKFVAKGRV